jgi:methylmalonyl-CoA/ethylmalonyl-CoA epimerase
MYGGGSSVASGPSLASVMVDGGMNNIDGAEPVIVTPASRGATVSLAEHPFHGPIHHLGYVVDDLEATVQRLVSQLGAGPFFVLRDVAFEQVTSRGEAATFHHDSAFGQCGAMPIEVVQLKRLEPERVREGFSQSPPQLHHTAYVVPPEHLAEAREDLERRGLPAFLQASLGDIDLTYHEAASLTGHHVELHADSHGLRDFFAMIHGASLEWDGSDPLRSPS